MQTFTQVPEWMGVALLGAVFAAAGYVAKLLFESLAEMFRRRRARRARLVELYSLLSAGRVAFGVQRENRNRLKSSLKKKNPTWASVKGSERLFTVAYSGMTYDERELHNIIRAYTVYTIKPLNELTLQWLREDTYFKARMGRIGRRARLAKRLADLEAHLVLWQAKYNIWIPDNAAHALVYLADEEHHGSPFPKGIENDIFQVIKPLPLRLWSAIWKAVRDFSLATLFAPLPLKAREKSKVESVESANQNYLPESD